MKQFHLDRPSGHQRDDVFDPATALAVTAATTWSRLFRAAMPGPARVQRRSGLSTFLRITRNDRTLDAVHCRVHDDPGSLWLRALIREAVNLSSDALRPGIREQDERICKRRKES